MASIVPDRAARLARYWSNVGLHYLPPARHRSVFVLGHPRTGTNWFCRIAASYYELPIFSVRTGPRLSRRPMVFHLHRFAGVPSRTVYTLRDGRDVMVSYYFKLLSTLPRSQAVVRRASRYCPLEMTRENVRENLAGFIRFLFEENTSSSIPWDRHVREALERGLHVVRFEDLLTEPVATVAEAIQRLEGTPPDDERVAASVEATSFERRTGRRRGEEDPRWRSVRKGIAGDWWNHFTPEAARLFDRFAGATLVEVGYEPDRRWVERVEARGAS